MKKVIAPCYKCEGRKVGCHADCERYLTYAGLQALEREKRYQESMRQSRSHTLFTATERKRRNQNGSKG